MITSHTKNPWSQKAILNYAHCLFPQSMESREAICMLISRFEVNFPFAKVTLIFLSIHLACTWTAVYKIYSPVPGNDYVFGC